MVSIVINVLFYRTTHKPNALAAHVHSAIYAMADVCPSVRPPVRPSVTRQSSIEMTEYVIKQLTPHGETGILDYSNQRSC